MAVSRLRESSPALALWNRPELLLDPADRAATSGFACDADPALGMERLGRDLADGTWERRHGHLRELSELDIGLRIVVAEIG